MPRRRIDPYGTITLNHHQIDSAIQWARVLGFCRSLERDGVTLVRAEMASDLVTLRFEKPKGEGRRVYRLFGVSWASLGEESPTWPAFLQKCVDEFARGVREQDDHEVEE